MKRGGKKDEGEIRAGCELRECDYECFNEDNRRITRT